MPASAEYKTYLNSLLDQGISEDEAYATTDQYFGLANPTEVAGRQATQDAANAAYAARPANAAAPQGAGGGWTWSRYQPTSGGSGEDAGYDPNQGSVEARQGGSWTGGTGPQPIALGSINSEGNFGTLFQMPDGSFALNGKPLNIDAATARAWLAGRSQQLSDEANSSNFGESLNKVAQVAIPAVILGGFAAAGLGAMGVGPLSGGVAGAGEGVAAAGAAEGAAAGEGLTSAAGASSAAANAAGYSLAPGTVTAQGALEAAVGNAGGMSLVPGSLATGSTPGIIAAAQGAAAGALTGNVTNIGPGGTGSTTDTILNAAGPAPSTTAELGTTPEVTGAINAVQTGDITGNILPGVASDASVLGLPTTSISPPATTPYAPEPTGTNVVPDTQEPAPQVEKSFNATPADIIRNTTPSLLGETDLLGKVYSNPFARGIINTGIKAALGDGGAFSQTRPPVTTTTDQPTNAVPNLSPGFSSVLGVYDPTWYNKTFGART